MFVIFTFLLLNLTENINIEYIPLTLIADSFKGRTTQFVFQAAENPQPTYLPNKVMLP